MVNLEKNIYKKYKELQSAVECTTLAIFVRYLEKIYICEDGINIKVCDFEKYNQDNNQKFIQNICIKSKTNVVAIMNNNNLANVKNLGKIPLMLDDFSEVFGGEVLFVDNAKKALKQIKRRRAVLLEDKGVIIRARSLDEAVTMIKILDKNAFILSKVNFFIQLSKTVSFLENYVFTKYYSAENQKRQWELETLETINNENDKNNQNNEEIVDENIKMVLEIAKKIYSSNSTQGTWGNVAVKIDDKTLYCTPKGIGYNLITAKDIIKMDYTTRKQLSAGVATSEKGIHCRIQNEYKEAKISIHAHPTYGSIFAARNQTLEVISEKGKELLGEKVYCSKHALPMTKKLTDNTVDNLRGGKAVFMGNHGITVWGKDIKEVFEVLDVLEEECRLQNS